jgi:lactobin A/cerein 7B family class IIb bacteriocin
VSENMEKELMNFDSNLTELEFNEMLEIEGGVNPWAVVAAAGGVVAGLNELWKFSGGFVKGFKDGVRGK